MSLSVRVIVILPRFMSNIGALQKSMMKATGILMPSTTRSPNLFLSTGWSGCAANIVGTSVVIHQENSGNNMHSQGGRFRLKLNFVLSGQVRLLAKQLWQKWKCPPASYGRQCWKTVLVVLAHKNQISWMYHMCCTSPGQSEVFGAGSEWLWLED